MLESALVTIVLLLILGVLKEQRSTHGAAAVSAWRAPLSGTPTDLPADGHPPIAITNDGDVVTAALAGDVDMQATFTAEPALERALESPGLSRIELDLRGLEFIDSTRMGLIVRLDQPTV